MHSEIAFHLASAVARTAADETSPLAPLATAAIGAYLHLENLITSALTGLAFLAASLT